jgi:hypothetical protein
VAEEEKPFHLVVFSYQDAALDAQFIRETQYIQLVLLRLKTQVAKLGLVVRRIRLHLISRKNLRGLFAAGFLVFLLAEWGTHGVIYANASSVEGPAIYSNNDGGHEDPCKTLICCSDTRRHEQEAPSGFDATPHNALFDRSAELQGLGYANKDPLALYSAVNSLWRPISPPFHPPELI